MPNLPGARLFAAARTLGSALPHAFEEDAHQGLRGLAVRRRLPTHGGGGRRLERQHQHGADEDRGDDLRIDLPERALRDPLLDEARENLRKGVDRRHFRGERRSRFSFRFVERLTKGKSRESTIRTKVPDHVCGEGGESLLLTAGRAHSRELLVQWVGAEQVVEGRGVQLRLGFEVLENQSAAYARTIGDLLGPGPGESLLREDVERRTEVGRASCRERV